MNTQNERMHTYGMDYPQQLIHYHQELSPLDGSFPPQSHSQSPNFLRSDMACQSISSSQVSFQQDQIKDGVFFSNGSLQWQVDIRNQSIQYIDPFETYHDGMVEYREDPLIKLNNGDSDDITSFFPKISTDLSHEKKKRPSPLNLVDSSVYPTPGSSTFPEMAKLQGFTLGSPVSPNDTLHSPLSASSDTFKLRSNSANSPNSINSPIVSTHSRISKPKSVPTIPKIARSGSHTTQPGPIPASKPTVRIDPDNGDELLTFSYSKLKIIKTFTIKCPVSPIDIREISEQFLKDNCVYPRAMVPIEEYKGNRGKYERECNEIGWTLAWYNPEIRNHRGLVQRAVDSWRNTRSDKTLRSRRVRKGDRK